MQIKSSPRRVRLKGRLSFAPRTVGPVYVYGSPEWELAVLEELGFGEAVQQTLERSVQRAAEMSAASGLEDSKRPDAAHVPRPFREARNLVLDLARLREAWSSVGRMSPGGFEDGDDMDGPTGAWIEDGSLTGHPGDWHREPPVFFERGPEGSPPIAEAVASVWNQIPFLLDELAARRSG